MVIYVQADGYHSLMRKIRATGAPALLMDFAFNELEELNVLPLWEYDGPECLELIMQEHPGSSDEQLLDAMFAEPVRIQAPGGHVYLLSAHAVLGVSEGSPGVQLLAAAKRRFINGKITWDIEQLVHIVPELTPDPHEAFYR